MKDKMVKVINNIELVEGQTYWYPSVKYFCHFSQTTVNHFVYHSDDTGKLQFITNEPFFKTREEALEYANEIRKLFGFPPID